MVCAPAFVLALASEAGKAGMRLTGSASHNHLAQMSAVTEHCRIRTQLEHDPSSPLCPFFVRQPQRVVLIEEQFWLCWEHASRERWQITGCEAAS